MPSKSYSRYSRYSRSSAALIAAGLLTAASAGCGLGADQQYLAPDLPLLPPNTSSTAAVVSLSPGEQDENIPEGDTSEVADPQTDSEAENGDEQPTTTTQGGGAEDESLEPLATLIPVMVKELNHDPTAFTQGLEYYEGRLFESTGAPSGRTSTIRELDPESGGAVHSQELGDDLFGEGITFVNGRIIQLTWRDGVAIIWDPDDFNKLGEFSYEGEGWGICYDGSRLVVSDGSEELHFRDPETFKRAGNPVTVTLEGETLPSLNELECVDGRVWANVWQTDMIVEIDPVSGKVLSRVDATNLGKPRPASPEAVLNGIAYNPNRNTFLLAGKDWPTIYEVRFEPSDEVEDDGEAGVDEANGAEVASGEETGEGEDGQETGGNNGDDENGNN